MPTQTTYTYSLALDAPGGFINSNKLQDAVRASSISAALASVDQDFGAGTFSLTFRDALGGADRATLDGGNGSGGTDGSPSSTHPALGLIKSTDNSPDAPTAQPVTLQNQPTVSVTPLIGGMGTRIDGGTLSATASQVVKLDYVVAEPMNLEGTVVQWEGFFLGDYGTIVIVNPAGTGTLASQAIQGATTISLPPQIAPYYYPENGADSVCFWSSDWSQLIEVVPIASASGTTITMAKALNNAHTTQENLRVRVGRFVPIRGANGTDGGFRLLTSGNEIIQHQTDVTEQVPAGLILSTIVWTTADAGTRQMVVNFVMRTPG